MGEIEVMGGNGRYWERVSVRELIGERDDRGSSRI